MEPERSHLHAPRAHGGHLKPGDPHVHAPVANAEVQGHDIFYLAVIVGESTEFFSCRIEGIHREYRIPGASFDPENGGAFRLVESDHVVARSVEIDDGHLGKGEAFHVVENLSDLTPGHGRIGILGRSGKVEAVKQAVVDGDRGRC